MFMVGFAFNVETNPGLFVGDATEIIIIEEKVSAPSGFSSDIVFSDTAFIIALLIMGISGGAILPLIFGFVSDSSNDMQSSYWVAIPCYVFILFYAFKGHKMRSW